MGSISSTSSTRSSQNETLGQIRLDKEGTPTKLNIHYRNATPDDACSTVKKSSSGHFFISLQLDGIATFFGKYSDGIFLASEMIKSQTEAKFYACLMNLDENSDLKSLTTKSVKLTDDQYEKAMLYLKNREARIYTAGIDDCVDFAQEVYNAAGLPLYFTSLYKRDELRSLEGLAVQKVRFTYGSIDAFATEFTNISAENKNALSAKLNVRVKDITELPGSNGQYFVDIDYALQQILQIRDEAISEVDKITIDGLRVDNIFEFIQVKLSAEYKIKISELVNFVEDNIKQYLLDTYSPLRDDKKKKMMLYKQQIKKEMEKVEVIAYYYKNDFQIIIFNIFFKKFQPKQLRKHTEYMKIKEYKKKCLAGEDDLLEKIKSKVKTSIPQAANSLFSKTYESKQKIYRSKIKESFDFDNYDKMSANIEREMREFLVTTCKQCKEEKNII